MKTVIITVIAVVLVSVLFTVVDAPEAAKYPKAEKFIEAGDYGDIYRFSDGQVNCYAMSRYNGGAAIDCDFDE